MLVLQVDGASVHLCGPPVDGPDRDAVAQMPCWIAPLHDIPYNLSLRSGVEARVADSTLPGRGPPMKEASVKEGPAMMTWPSSEGARVENGDSGNGPPVKEFQWRSSGKGVPVKEAILGRETDHREPCGLMMHGLTTHIVGWERHRELVIEHLEAVSSRGDNRQHRERVLDCIQNEEILLSSKSAEA